MFDSDKHEDFNSLDDESKSVLIHWIHINIKPAKKLWDMSSYSLKEKFENDGSGFFISNGQFKGAMLEAGFIPENPNEQNWFFNIIYREKPERFGSEGSFYEWMKNQIDRKDSVGELARDIFMDESWPVEENNYLTCRRYLRKKIDYELLFEGLKLAHKELKLSKVD